MLINEHGDALIKHSQWKAFSDAGLDGAKSWPYYDRGWALLEEDFERCVPTVFLDTSVGNYHKFGCCPTERYPILAARLERSYTFDRIVEGVGVYWAKSNETLCVSDGEL